MRIKVLPLEKWMTKIFQPKNKDLLESFEYFETPFCTPENWYKMGKEEFFVVKNENKRFVFKARLEMFDYTLSLYTLDKYSKDDVRLLKSLNRTHPERSRSILIRQIEDNMRVRVQQRRFMKLRKDIKQVMEE